jgi:hypothetical protein
MAARRAVLMSLSKIGIKVTPSGLKVMISFLYTYKAVGVEFAKIDVSFIYLTN